MFCHPPYPIAIDVGRHLPFPSLPFPSLPFHSKQYWHICTCTCTTCGYYYELPSQKDCRSDRVLVWDSGNVMWPPCGSSVMRRLGYYCLIPGGLLRSRAVIHNWLTISRRLVNSWRGTTGGRVRYNLRSSASLHLTGAFVANNRLVFHFDKYYS